jgi:hypothetical protein
VKFKAKAKDCQLLVKAKTAFGETIDEKELDRFSRVFLRGFLKPKMVKKNLIEYTGPVGISLYDRLKRPVTKREFLFILEQVVVAVQKLQANNMGINNLVMNLQYVYINEVTKEVQFVYVPTVMGQQNMNLIEFIEAIAYSVKPADEKDNDFVSRFIYFFKAMKPFNINKVEAFVGKEDRSVVNTIKKQNVGQSRFMTNKQQHYYDHYDEKKGSDDGDEPTGLLSEEDDDPTGLLVESGDDNATGLLTDDDDEATGLLDNCDDEATGLLICTGDEDEATGLLIENNANVRFPTLFRILTEETISINKPVFRLGKERSYVDYFVTNNIAVSRSHADIITRGNKYFVKDLNSKNHTYINNQELPIHMEVEIYDGDRLKLGNEEFIFNI